MTTIRQEKVKCAVCGTLNDCTVVTSTSSFGSPDLDTRPSPMQRDIIYFVIHRCSACNYSSRDLSECSHEVSEFVKTKKYQEIMQNTNMSSAATSYVALSHSYEHIKEYVNATWASINAAWVCDDDENAESARKCRGRAISMAQEAITRGETIVSSEFVGETEMIVIDLMRRAGLFEDALKMIDMVPKETFKQEILVQIIEYQKHLIAEKKSYAQKISDAVEWYKGA